MERPLEKIDACLEPYHNNSNWFSHQNNKIVKIGLIRGDKTHIHPILTDLEWKPGGK